MDFHSLTRRELQALCKKNKIPANITNVAMADALASLKTVDGIEEFLNPSESETANSSMVSPEKSEKVSASVPRTSTMTSGRARGTTAKAVNEAKVEMIETPALPTTRRRRAAATSVRSKLETSMKECESDEHIGDQVEMEKKEVPRTPAAGHTSRRREVKAKSSVTQVYSTRRSTRLAGKTSSESITQENEKSGTITYDAYSEDDDENLEVDSKQHSSHENEELDRNGIDLKAAEESLDVNKDSEILSVQDSNVLVENLMEVEVGVQEVSADSLAVDVLNKEAEKGLEVEVVYHSNNGLEVYAREDNVLENGIQMVSGEEESGGLHSKMMDVELLEDSVVDAFNSENENQIESMNEANGNKQIEGSAAKEVNDGEEETKDEDIQNKTQDLGHDAKASLDFPNVTLSKQLTQENQPHRDEIFDFEEDNVVEENHDDEMYECEVDDGTESNSDDAGEGELMEHKKEKGEINVSGNLQCLKDVSEANVELPGDELMDKSEVDDDEADVDNTAAAPLFPLVSLVPNAKSMGEVESFNTETNLDVLDMDLFGQLNREKEAKASEGLHLLQDVSEANIEFAGEEPIKEFEVDDAQADLDPAAHSPVASPIPNAASKSVSTLILEPVHIPSASTTVNPVLISETSCLTPVKISSSKTPMKKSMSKASAATKVAQIHDDKENIDNSGRKFVLTKEKLKKNKSNAVNNSKQSLQDLSLRQLTKMLKEMHISKDPKIMDSTNTKVASSRPALQTLPENRLTGETEK
ncbi:PREDICTED: uncharacterized protein LOC109214124 [Nicotiana attenuata]|uniref:Uncharacterized protein n=1 Tax=Nicotiana attenuata TaxID=49451 RepID=A0A1J6L0C0_NICAT|nr:PREDICTED: uncharacterized protein LOC109214124 [Nicotiana attenuata]OIT27303.1 hypothetical protein A4A49_23683 [Nicotiana attenuata]